MKKFSCFLVAVLIIVGLVGCGTTNDTGTTTTQPPYKVPVLTADEALAIALKHAGYTQDQVTKADSRYQVEDKIPEYEVEFCYDTLEFEYTIHADTGEILEYGKEQNSPTGDTNDQPKLSQETARDIALKHAGVGRNEIEDLEIEFEVENGVPVYSVEFRLGKWELEYEIHANTGDILKSEKNKI